MSFRKCVAVMCLINLTGSYVHAATLQDINNVIGQAEQELTNDSNLLSGWLVDQVRYAIPFNSTTGDVVPSQLHLFGFEAGVEGVATGTEVDTNALHALPTTLVNTQSIDSFSRFPLPMIIGHAKIGLPLGFDAGFRFGGLPKTTIDNGSNHATMSNHVFGLDLRNKLIEEGVVRPFGLTVGVNYTHADGTFDLSAPFSGLTKDFQSGGQSYTGQVNDGVANNHSSWSSNSYGLQALLDKQIFFFTPYIGGAVNYNAGSVSNSITTTGLGVVTDSMGNSVDEAVSATGGASAAMNKWDARALFGAEFTIFPFTKLGLGGEYGGSKNIGGSLGLRVQF